MNGEKKERERVGEGEGGGEKRMTLNVGVECGIGFRSKRWKKCQEYTKFVSNKSVKEKGRKSARGGKREKIVKLKKVEEREKKTTKTESREIIEAQKKLINHQNSAWNRTHETERMEKGDA